MFLGRTLKGSVYSGPVPRIFLRGYKVLSIETSCDDTCIALMERSEDKVELIQHIKATLDSSEFGGIVPNKAFNFHQQNLSRISQELFKKNGISAANPPDVICVTRGPGMAGSLTVGIEFAKGLSVAFDRPYIGVHHMLGHLLVPRFETSGQTPQFPFLNLLVSGGHTMLVLSKDLLNHEILCNTIDIAAGDSLDKCAREIGIKDNNKGKGLEDLVNANPDHWDYQKITMPKPLYNKHGRMEMISYSFAPFHGALQRAIAKDSLDINNEAIQRSLGYQIEQSLFGHMIDKLKLVLERNQEKLKDVEDFVASGGVASNLTLRKMLDEALKPTSIKRTSYPSPSLCTDNAIMIGWAGIELYEAGFATDMNISPTTKWPLTDLLNVPGWIKK